MKKHQQEMSLLKEEINQLLLTKVVQTQQETITALTKRVNEREKEKN